MSLIFRKGLLFLLVAALVGCANKEKESRYSMSQDAPPSVELDVSTLPEVVPVYEPQSRGGNKSPYEVWGKSYNVLPTAEGYKEQGGASWYGAKFHGHKTSNGETYNMYEMSAAHKSLPLPTYVKVTNLDNGRSVIVRVNDRGPFHEGRIIDLSYAAAKKLGYYDQGTARVEVEAISVAPSANSATAQVAEGSAPHSSPQMVNGAETLVKGQGYFVQVGAFSSESSAQKLVRRIESEVNGGGFVITSTDDAKTFHRVRMGPYYNRQKAEQVQKQLEASKLGSPIIITRSVQRTG